MKYVSTALFVLGFSFALIAHADGGDYSAGYRAGFADGYQAGRKDCGGGSRTIFYRCNLRANAIDNWSDWLPDRQDAEQQAYDRCLANPRATKNWCDVFRSDTQCYTKQ